MVHTCNLSTWELIQDCGELEGSLNYRNSVFKNQKQKNNPGARETAQQLRTLVLAEDLGLVPRISMVAPKHL